MRRYLGIGVAWLGATVLSVVIASAAVAGIRDRVVETPVAIGPPTTTTTTVPVATDPPLAIPETTATTSATAAPNTTVVTTTEPPATTETTVVTGTTAPPAPTTTTTTTTAPPQTTTTQPLAYSTHDLVGGTVILSFGNGEVRVVSAVPRPGFSYEAERTGPVEVELKFTSDDHRSKLEAHVDGGELKVHTEEEGHDGDDD